MNGQVFKVGARGSKLSLVQTNGAIEVLKKAFPETKYKVAVVETPGDRDLTTPIEKSDPDFFTRDLDEAVRDGRIDFAIHSAKDLPERMADDLDWFWLPSREDPCDCIVYRQDDMFKDKSSGIFGISSERRRKYVEEKYPNAKIMPIRGAIDSRVQQVRDGKYDYVLMAMAGLQRLYRNQIPNGIVIEPISTTKLEPPEAQGYLAVVFRVGDERIVKIRDAFVKAVRFVSAGVGSAAFCTVAGVRDLTQADVILYDDLMGESLVRTYASKKAKLIHVGKRCGAHSMQQTEITQLLCDEARKSRRVVRLKGGDAGLFGRLAEETDALTKLRIAFVVRPGVSALTAGTTGTGVLLTRRGESRGFTVYTPRSTGTETPLVLFMATRMLEEEAKALIERGMPPSTPCALVLDAGGFGEEVRQMTLETVRNLEGEERPGLFVVGDVATHLWPKLGAFGARRVLVTCSEAVQERAVTAVEDRGGKPILWPLIKLVPRELNVMPDEFDGIVFTSPSSVRIFFEVFKEDRRCVPGTVFTCGGGTDAELLKYGIKSDYSPASDFSAKGLIRMLEMFDDELEDLNILRLRSAKAGDAVTKAFESYGANVTDVILYDNEFTAPSEKLPKFDDVFFASASAVESFLAQYGAAALDGKGILVMGEPTRVALPRHLKNSAIVLRVDV